MTYYVRIASGAFLLRGSEHTFASEEELADYIDRLTTEELSIMATYDTVEIQLFDLTTPTTRYTIDKEPDSE